MSKNHYTQLKLRAMDNACQWDNYPKMKHSANVMIAQRSNDFNVFTMLFLLLNLTNFNIHFNLAQSLEYIFSFINVFGQNKIV
jgi:hypothetical protein